MIISSLTKIVDQRFYLFAMFIVDDVLISTEVLAKKFVCDLDRCKGACCWEGDYGAPVDDQEIATIKDIYDIIAPMLTEEARHIISNEGFGPFNPIYKGAVTPLMPNGSCVYLATDDSGIARCSFEMAHEQGLTEWRKPSSCHLYPIRVSKNKKTGWEALNYDEWDICSAACANGEKLQIPLFRFAKDAIVTKYGQDFYDQLEVLYRDFINKDEDNK